MLCCGSTQHTSDTDPSRDWPQMLICLVAGSWSLLGPLVSPALALKGIPWPSRFGILCKLNKSALWYYLSQVTDRHVEQDVSQQ